MDSQHWSKDQMLAFQQSQLEQLLRHAKRNVPFYKSRLDCVFRPDDSIDWNRWSEIPILTRADLRDHGKKLLATSLPEGHGEVSSFESSGSTGIPIKVTTTSLADSVRRALWSRFYALNKLKETGIHVKFWFTTPGEKPFTENFVADKKQDSKLFYGNRNLSIQKQLDVLRDTKAESLSEFSTTLVHMAHENLARKVPVKLKLVVPYGMGIAPSDLSVMKMSFGAKVLMPYSSKEAGLMAYHVLPDTRYVMCSEALLPEFLPIDGNDEPALRRLIVTPFFNAAQPLIRYDQGDYVELAKGTTLSAAHPKLERVVGRSDDYFVLKGKKVPVVGLKDETLNRLLQAKAFQLAQTASNTVEMRYVANRKITAAVKSALTKHMRIKLQQDFDVKYIKLKTIPSSSGGKQQRFKREFMS